MSSSDAPTPEGRRFLAWLLASVALLAAAILGITWLLDPYGLLGARGHGTALCTPGIRIDDDRYLKPLLPRLYQPEEILLGSSRARWAFHEEFFTRRTGRRTVNLALNSASLEEIDRLTRQAIADAPVRRVWIGVDFGAFAMPDWAPGRLATLWPIADPEATALRYGLLDPHAMRAGLFALIDPATCRDPVLTPHGFIRGATPYGDSPLPVLPSARQRAAILRHWRFDAPARAAAYAERLARLDALLAFLHQRGVAVILFLTPSHPLYQEMLAEAGLAERRLRWREQVRALAARHGATLLLTDTPAFLDSIRAPGCPADARPVDCLFYDTTHSRPVVGEAIVRAALAQAAPGS
jgi:hypothetical protein